MWSGRSILRTRSERNRMLPLSVPITRRSPSGKAAVISRPSSPTRAWMAASSNTTRPRWRPGARGSSMAGHVYPERRLTCTGHQHVGAADRRNPGQFSPALENRPAGPVAAGDPGVLKATNRQPVTGAMQRRHPVAGAPPPDHQRAGDEPGRAAVARLSRWCGFGGPIEAEVTPVHATPLSRDRLTVRCACRLRRKETEPVPGTLQSPAAAQIGGGATLRFLEAPRRAPQTPEA